MQHAVLLGSDNWMRLNTRSCNARPPCPHENGGLGERTLSHHATTGLSAYAIDSAATNGGFHLLYDVTVGVILSNGPLLLEVNLVRGNGSPELTGPYLVDTLLQSSILSRRGEHFVASGL